MIPIKRNHFYTKEIVSNAVGIYPQFKDFAGGSSETTLEFKGGLGALRYAVSGNVSTTPPYKSSELRGGFLQYYVTGMSMSGNTTLPQMSAYKLQNGIPISEGGFSLATGTTSITQKTLTPVEGQIGDALWFSYSQQSDDNIYLEESFDGAGVSLGSSFNSSFGGAAEFSLDDAYVEPQEGADTVWAGGDAFFGGGGSNSVVHNLTKWFSRGGPDYSDMRVFVRPNKKNRPSGLWTAVSDHRGDKEKWQIYAPFWKWEQIRPILKFGSKEAKTPTEEDPTATNQNTIFDRLYVANRQSGSPLTASEAGPNLSSSAQLVSGEGDASGQSLLLSNKWTLGTSPIYNIYDWFSSGRQKAGTKIPTQTIGAEVHNIPYPLPNNIGGLIDGNANSFPNVSGQSYSGSKFSGDQRTVFPEIELSMKINNLLPSPAIDLSDSAIAGTVLDTYNDPVATNITQIGSSACGEVTISSNTTDIYPHNKTFWRSIVITFSNTDPSMWSNLDEYLKDNQERALGRLTSKYGDVPLYSKFVRDADGYPHLGPSVLGGIVISAFYPSENGTATGSHQDGDGNGYLGAQSEVYAYNLPVSPYLSGSGYNTTNPLLRIKSKSETGGPTADWAPEGAMLHRPTIGPLQGSSRTMPYVKLPQNETINMKIVIDPQQPWSKATSWGWHKEPTDKLAYGEIDATAGEYSGVPMRVYFMTQEESTELKETTTADQETIKGSSIPWLNVAFSSENDDDSQYSMTTISPEGVYDILNQGGNANYFPKYMKIWVNNVGFAPASGSTPAYWGGENTWFDAVNWVSDDTAHPIIGGSWTGPNPIESSLAIDKIVFRNFTANTINMSAPAGITSRSLTAQNEKVLSPAAAIYSGTDYTRGFDMYGTFWPLKAGFNVTLGYKDWDWHPIVEASPAGGTSTGSKAGFLLFNNFNTFDMDALERASPVAAWVSTYDSQSYIGAYNKYPGMEMGCQPHVTSISTYVNTQGLSQKAFVTTGSTSAPTTTFASPTPPYAAYTENAYISMGYGGSGNWLGSDGLTQKGFMKLNFSSGSSSPSDDYSTDSTDGKMVPRENVLTSAKILAGGTIQMKGQSGDRNPRDHNQIIVDNIDIFHQDLDDEYIIYKAGFAPRPDNSSDNPIESGTRIGADFTGTGSVTDGDNILTGSAGAFSDVQEGMGVVGSGLASYLNPVVIHKAGNDKIYLSSNSRSTATSVYTFSKAASCALGYKLSLKMIDKDIANNTVTLQVTSGSTILDYPLLFADDRKTRLLSPSHDAFDTWGVSMSHWYISPKRYWFNMMFGNEFDTRRKYENVCMVDETPATGSLSTQTGSTFNESAYTYNISNMATKGVAAMLETPWILGVTDDRTALIVNEDFGYGSYDDEKDAGGEAGVAVPILNTAAYFNLSKMVEAVSPGPEEEITLVLGLTDEVSKKVVTVVGDDTTLDTSGSTYYRPQYVWEYYDERPSLKNFTVSSEFDVLSPDVNLYELTKQSINNMKFKWDETGEDIWYRHLMIDSSGSIDNKYHRSSFWAPINEINVNDTSTYFYYNLSDVEDKDTTQYLRKYSGTTPQMTIDGISGYAPYFKNSATSGAGPPCYVLGDYTTTTGSYKELEYSMANEMAGSLSSNAWVDKWSLSVHCNPQWSDAAADTRSRGMTVCGVIQCVSGAQTQSGAPSSGPRIRVYTGSRSTPQGDKTYDFGDYWNLSSTGGFDLLHVYMKDSRVYVGYNVQYEKTGDGAAARPYMAGNNRFEALLLSSSTSYKMDGTQPLAITVSWNKNRGTDTGDIDTATTITSDDQFRLYVNGQLEDSQSTKWGVSTANVANITGPTGNGGGFGMSNYSKFFVGCVPGGSEATWDGFAVTNVYAGVGEETSSGVFNYRMSENGFQGKIEEVILYPYEVYVPDKAGEYILNTRTLDDFSAVGTTGKEKNYTGRLFAFDFTNVRGKSPESVGTSSQVQWKVTGV